LPLVTSPPKLSGGDIHCHELLLVDELEWRLSWSCEVCSVVLLYCGHRH